MIFPQKPIQRIRRVAFPGFYLNGIKFWLHLAVVRQDKVYLHIVAMLCFVIMRIKKQFESARHKTLCDRVLEQHPLIDGKSVVQDLFVEFFLGGTLSKGEARYEGKLSERQHARQYKIHRQNQTRRHGVHQYLP